MSRRKSHLEPATDSLQARVDDTLLRNHRLRQRIHRILGSKQSHQLSVEDARKMALQIQKKGPNAINALFDSLFDEENRDKQRLAVMLLSEMNDPAVFERIHTLLQRPRLPEKVRVALLAIEAIHSGAPDALPVPSGIHSLSLDSVLQFTENFWDAMEMEEVAMMWREHFINESPQDRLGLLNVLMKSAHPKLLGIARLEILAGDVKVIQFLAEKLADFDSPIATRMLKTLLEHPDLVVRTMADASLQKLRERARNAAGPDDRSGFTTRFYRAYAATDEWSGHYSLVYAVKSHPGDLIKFAVFLLDRWDRGIVDCWGCVHYSDKQFEQLMATMAKDFADLRQERIHKRTALTLLVKAMDLNFRRRHSLPLEFAIWSHLFENDSFEPDSQVPEFGVNCSLCRKPIRTGPRTTPPWVFGDLVVCHRCSKRSLRCPNCGGSTALVECLLTSEESQDSTGLRCPHCFESFHMSPEGKRSKQTGKQ